MGELAALSMKDKDLISTFWKAQPARCRVGHALHPDLELEMAGAMSDRVRLKGVVFERGLAEDGAVLDVVMFRR